MNYSALTNQFGTPIGFQAKSASANTTSSGIKLSHVLIYGSIILTGVAIGFYLYGKTSALKEMLSERQSAFMDVPKEA